MPSLHTAVSLVEVDHVAVGVGQDLNLDVARVDHRLFEVDHRISERRFSFPAGRLDGFGQCVGLADPPHPAPAAAGNRFDEQREFHVGRGGYQLVDRRRRRRRRQDRQAGFARRCDRAGLVTGQLKHFGAGADEGDAEPRAGGRQFGVLRKETVSGIHRVSTRTAGGGDDLTDRQICAYRVADVADLVGLVSFQAVQRISVFIGIDSDSADTKFVGGPECPDRDLAAIGDQHFGNHLYP